MNRYLLAFAFLFAISVEVVSQDVPVYSQKLTNSFLYNPSVAGNTLGSAPYHTANNGPERWEHHRLLS